MSWYCLFCMKIAMNIRIFWVCFCCNAIWSLTSFISSCCFFSAVRCWAACISYFCFFNSSSAVLKFCSLSLFSLKKFKVPVPLIHNFQHFFSLGLPSVPATSFLFYFHWMFAAATFFFVLFGLSSFSFSI